MGLVLVDLKMRSLHLPVRILKVYVETLTGSRHLHCPEVLNNTSLTLSCLLETAARMGRISKELHSRDQEGHGEHLILLA